MITIKCGRFSDHSSITTQHQPHAMAFISTGNIFILCSFLMQCAPFKEQPREEHIKATAATYNRALFSYCFLVSKKFNFLNLHQKKGGGGVHRTGQDRCTAMREVKVFTFQNLPSSSLKALHSGMHVILTCITRPQSQNACEGSEHFAKWLWTFCKSVQGLKT